MGWWSWEATGEVSASLFVPPDHVCTCRVRPAPHTRLREDGAPTCLSARRRILRNVSILEHTPKTGAKKCIRKGGAAGGYNKGHTEGLAFHLQMAEMLTKEWGMARF